MALPPRTLRTSSRVCARRMRFAISVRVGLLSIPLAFAVSEWISSSRVKCGVRFISWVP
ncbi:hypothetical protein [Achromobacter phage tuull]|nr:hypothetical protein [Achromobacter phage tuull]